MAEPTAIIVDDEAAVLSHLQKMLAACWPELRVIDTAQNGREAIAKIGAQAPDIVFLDIKMPGMTGLDVARELSKQVHLVFVTAFDEFAIDAFEHAATDYLLKPVEQIRLTETVARLKDKYTGVFTAHKEYVVRAPLAELEQQLDPAQFWRIHRGIIVAVKEIKSAKKDMRGRYTLSLRSRPEPVRSSAAYKHLFAQM